MTLEEKIKRLANAGMRLDLSENNIDALSQLDDAQIEQLVTIVQDLGTGGGGLTLTDFPSTQPPGTGPRS